MVKNQTNTPNSRVNKFQIPNSQQTSRTNPKKISLFHLTFSLTSAGRRDGSPTAREGSSPEDGRPSSPPAQAENSLSKREKKAMTTRAVANETWISQYEGKRTPTEDPSMGGASATRLEQQRGGLADGSGADGETKRRTRKRRRERSWLEGDGRGSGGVKLKWWWGRRNKRKERRGVENVASEFPKRPGRR